MRRLRQLTQAVGRLRSLGFAEAALVVPMEQQAGRTVAQPWLESGELGCLGPGGEVDCRVAPTVLHPTVHTERPWRAWMRRTCCMLG